MNHKEAIGQYEFTSLPQALFSMTGVLLPCIDKSKLMTILEVSPKDGPADCAKLPENVSVNDVQLPQKEVTIIDGIAVVHAIGKPCQHGLKKNEQSWPIISLLHWTAMPMTVR